MRSAFTRKRTNENKIPNQKQLCNTVLTAAGTASNSARLLSVPAVLLAVIPLPDAALPSAPVTLMPRPANSSTRACACGINDSFYFYAFVSFVINRYQNCMIQCIAWTTLVTWLETPTAFSVAINFEATSVRTPTSVKLVP